MSKVKFQTQLWPRLFLNSFHTRWNLCDLLQKMLPLWVSLLALSLAALIHFSPWRQSRLWFWSREHLTKLRIWTLCPLGLFRSFLRFMHLSLCMFSMLVLKGVIFMLCRKRRLFIRALRKHCLTLMIYLTIVPSQTLALFLSCLSGLFMLSCSSI